MNRPPPIQNAPEPAPLSAWEKASRRDPTQSTDPFGLNPARRIAVTALKVLAASAIAVLLWHQFAGLDALRILGLLHQVGFAVIVVLIPPLLASLTDSLGLALCVSGLRPIPGLLKVFPVRIGCDAMLNSIPAGIAAGETLRPFWLRRAVRIPIEESVAACLMGKMNMAASQGFFYTVIMALLAISGTQLSANGGSVPSALSIFLIVLIPSIVALSVGFVYTGSRLTQFVAQVKRLPWERWKPFLASIEPRVSRIDATILHLVRQSRARLVGSLVAFLAGWIMLGFESYTILVLLGQNVSIGQGLLLEGTASILRIVFFFIPSALGAAEAAYISLISGYGASDPTSVAVAFITIKRAREILWIAAGYAALMFSHWRERNSAPEARPQLTEIKD